MGGKKKRQDLTSLKSSSSRRDSVSPVTTAHQTTSHVSVGCMSGIFQLVSKYHTRRKFLTFGSRKQEREASSSSPPPKNQKLKNATLCQPHEQNSSTTLSLEVPRSPAIPAEIRKSSLDFANSPRVVERLLGLDDIPATLPTPVTPELAVEKRRKLLGALEKCDEDLQALKRIIEAVRAGTTAPSTPPHVVRAGCFKEDYEEEDGVGSEEPSPVSVLDHHQLLTRSSPPRSPVYSKRTRDGKVLHLQPQIHKEQQQRQHTARKKPGEEDNVSFCFQYRPFVPFDVVTTTPQSVYVSTKNPLLPNTNATTSLTAPWSRAMRESVTEVCRDVELGHKRELGIIGLLIEDLLYRDLVAEVIQDLNCFHVNSTSHRILPYEACKRKLCF